MVGMMELKHCMQREKSDLPLYFDTYSLFLKQPVLLLLVAKDIFMSFAFHFCLLLTMSNLITYLHKQSNLCLKLYTRKVILHPAGNIVPEIMQDG